MRRQLRQSRRRTGMKQMWAEVTRIVSVAALNSTRRDNPVCSDYTSFYPFFAFCTVFRLCSVIQKRLFKQVNYNVLMQLDIFPTPSPYVFYFVSQRTSSKIGHKQHREGSNTENCSNRDANKTPTLKFEDISIQREKTDKKSTWNSRHDF